MMVNNLRPIHPCEILRDEFLIAVGMPAHALAAKSIHVPAPHINNIIREKCSLSPDTVLRLSR